MDELKTITIIGAGLAGSTLAWQLFFRGNRPVIFDIPIPNSASRIAAGLITPITGKRMAISWNFETLWPAAVAFYRRVESTVSRPVFQIQQSVRLFQSAEERQAFHDRIATLTPYVVPIAPELHGVVKRPFGGFAMAPAAVLDVSAYLDATREFFSVRNAEVVPAAFPQSDHDPEAT